MFTLRMEEALTLAAVRHRDQTRRGNGAPYITHLTHVALILARFGHPEDTLITGLLHDILEDTCDSLDEVADLAKELDTRFGSAVAQAVRALTEPKVSAAGERLKWRVRKERYLAQLAEAPTMSIHVSAADKIHNLSTLLIDIERHGPEVWRRFRGGPEQSAWFYGEVQKIVERKAEDRALAQALSPIVERLQASVRAIS